MKKFIFAFLILCLSSTVSADSFNSYLAKADPFYPDTIHYFCSPIDIKENTLFGNGFSFFQLHRSKTNNSKIWYISTFYHSDHWIFVQKLKFLIDGAIYEIKSDPNPKRETGSIGDAYVEETNYFQIPDRLIEAIKAAKTITLRLEGENYYLDRVMPEEDIKNLSWFIDQMKSSIDNAQQPYTKPNVVFGVSFADISPEVSLSLNRGDIKGVIVVSVTPNSICEKSGIKVGDIIYEYDGKPIHESLDLKNAVGVTKQGAEVIIKIIRQNRNMLVNAKF